MISFSFDSLIWKNLRSKIRSLSVNSVWYQFLNSLQKIIQDRLNLFRWIFDQIWLETSSEQGLDAWGKRLGISRFENESDVEYRYRLVYYKSNRNSGLSRKQKAVVLSNLLGINLSLIQIINITNDTMIIGGEIGSPIASSHFMLFGYKVIINKELSNSQRKLLVDFINSVNIGGNYPLFCELNPLVPIMSMGGSIGDQILSSKETPRSVFQYY